MSWSFVLQLLVTVLVIVLGANWLLSSFLLDFKRDLTAVALAQQSSIASVRNEHETAYYRSILVPTGFPLTTGLGLSLKYKIRNGNFGDVWNAIMEVSKGKNTIKLIRDEKSTSLGELNGMGKRIFQKLSTENYKNIGISNSVATKEGFTLTLASMMASIKTGSVPHFLPAVPRQQVKGLDVLVIDSWRSFKLLNGSEDWYKLIIVCDDPKRAPLFDSKDYRVVTWLELIDGYVNDSEFQYTPPDDNSDDKKLFAHVTSPWNGTNSFNQICLVSNIAEFIKGFPLGNELNSSERITISTKLASSSASLQIWGKLFAVLLHGGSASFINHTNLDCKSLQKTTLLFIETEELRKLMYSISKHNWLHKLYLSWATNLLSEGIFTKIAQIEPKSLEKLRCVYSADTVKDAEIISEFPEKIPQLKKTNQRTTPSTEDLNKIRAQLGSRVVLELYCPYAIMGAVAHTNFYDYRVFEKSVDDNVVCYGPLTTTLEGKMVETETNPLLNIETRQGMLCIRGFTIGKPVESDRLEKAMSLAEKFGGGEGWMPLIGVFGLWGQDGCLYTYNQ
ncbi:YHR045W [Saccharomyces arboricola H-6]|uniref:YHR045W n=1 Tax=Saccharomyces arboricola (strain H-6 / AS 2.3317 / CBS 10644) TaxID=1160507 RepID=J8Q736_SACAR|nr:YHR045W [Saccharomyces arboricola H-6]